MVLSERNIGPGDPGEQPFPNEPAVDEPELEAPGEDPGSLDAPADPDDGQTALDRAAGTPISR
ncbi:MAG: hypothetical protein ABR509_01400 [Candidatus Limnocylindria bacterium]